jgi:hypothetical protein
MTKYQILQTVAGVCHTMLSSQKVNRTGNSVSSRPDDSVFSCCACLNAIYSLWSSFALTCGPQVLWPLQDPLCTFSNTDSCLLRPDAVLSGGGFPTFRWDTLPLSKSKLCQRADACLLHLLFYPEEGNAFFWNVGKLVHNCTASYIRVSYIHSHCRENGRSHIHL